MPEKKQSWTWKLGKRPIWGILLQGGERMQQKKKDRIFPDDSGAVFDPLGSYTGKPDDPDETPVQDADDL